MFQNHTGRILGQSSPRLLRAMVFGAAYFLCAGAGSYLSARGGIYVSFWLPAGLYVAALLLNETRDWPGLALAALPANLAFDFFHDANFSLPLVLLFYCANTLQALLGAWLVRRFVAERPTLATLKELAGLLAFGAVLSTMLGAVIGAATLKAFGLSDSFLQSWRVWWGSCAMTVLVMSPFILTWFSQPRPERFWLNPPNKILEAIALFAGLTFFAWYALIVKGGIMSPYKHWVIPLLLWAGLRFGVRGATAATLYVSLLVAFLTTQFLRGLTPAQISSGEYVFILQTTLATVSMISVIPAIVLAERDQTLARLRKSELLFRAIVEDQNEMIVRWIPDGTRTFVNAAYCRVFGGTSEQLVGSSFFPLISEQDRAIVLARIRGLTPQNPVSTAAHHSVSPGGKALWQEWTDRAMFDETGRMVELQSTGRDITERKQAEQALRNSEERLRATIENTPYVAVQWYDAQGRILFWNHASEIMFGWSAAEAVSQTLDQLIHTREEAATFVKVLAEVERSGKATSPVEFPFRRRDGARRVCLSTIFRIPFDGGQSCFVCMDVDVSERKAAEESLLNAQARVLRSREEFAQHLIVAQETERSRIAAELHDSLCQNLSIIKIRSHLARQVAAGQSKAANHLEAIERLVSDAITETRNLAHNLRPAHIEQIGLTDSLQGLIREVSQSSQIRFERRLENVDDIFKGDNATNVYRIVQEALNNLIKHSQAHEVTVTLERDVRAARLRVADDGVGFDAHAVTARRGLGLTSMAERVRMLGGSLKIETAPGRGTQLIIELPFAEAPDDEATQNVT